jgi:ArsR family transcriptional regulator, arsenate/arsenite/antimonite-responsive transcriptional repressor
MSFPACQMQREAADRSPEFAGAFLTKDVQVLSHRSSSGKDGGCRRSSQSGSGLVDGRAAQNNHLVTSTNFNEASDEADAGQGREGPEVTTVVKPAPAPPAIELAYPSLLAGPMDRYDADELAATFGALADPVRWRLLSLIVASTGGEVCACEFIVPLNKSQSTVSHHLAVLMEAGLITGERRGRWVWYSIVPERFLEVQLALGE